jgi:hypothetical protein
MDANTKKDYNHINRRRKQWANEEDVRHAWKKGLEEALQIDLDAEKSKRNSSYNDGVIKFKGPDPPALSTLERLTMVSISV